jgi:hypothetical protein
LKTSSPIVDDYFFKVLHNYDSCSLIWNKILLPPNGLCFALASLAAVLVGGIGHHPGALLGRDNATLPEPA